MGASRRARSSSSSAASARRRACSSSSSASAVSPANQSSPLAGSYPKPSARHRGNRGREQLLLRDDRHLGHEPRRVSADEDDEAAEARVARPLEELEGAGRIVADDGGGASAQRRSDGSLAARLDLEQRERDPLALLGQRAGGRRQSLALGESAIEGAQTFLQEPDLLGERLSLGADPAVEHAPRPLELVAQPLQPCARGLTPQLEPLGRAAEPVEHLHRLLALAGRVGELLLGAAALGEHRLEPLLARRAARAAAAPPFAGSASRSSSVARSSSAMRARSRAISPRSFSARSAAVACSASGRSRFSHLVLEVACALDLRSRRARASARRGGGAP